MLKRVARFFKDVFELPRDFSLSIGDYPPDTAAILYELRNGPLSGAQLIIETLILPEERAIEAIDLLKEAGLIEERPDPGITYPKSGTDDWVLLMPWTITTSLTARKAS